MSKPAPRVEVLSKTNVTLTVSVTPASNKMQLAYSEYGYVYYSWTEVDIVASPSTIKGLQPNTCYIVKARHWNDETSTWSDYGPLSQYMRTFSEEEETKRSSTYYEHALKMEKEHRQEMQNQIEKLQRMLTDPGAKKRQPTPQENLMESRMDVEATISKLKSEIKVQAQSMEALAKMRRMDEQVITDLLAEQEKLRDLQTQQAPGEQHEIERLKSMLEQNENKLKVHRWPCSVSHMPVETPRTNLDQTIADSGIRRVVGYQAGGNCTARGRSRAIDGRLPPCDAGACRRGSLQAARARGCTAGR
ncbi:hypothetical protein, variant [Aphanomyces invadans]|uniref:Uncharacterized protein n=1 Tax=Aphanomyces invadans TaxID=157072 RepID=A0A024UU83_9STRA|nr:hypothetical protein, variant [Aphanomyces invadans]ETW09889.1 hypothetical protein, variant [Aphanomyces invadans]|eukprot:XP_008861300.1 hypothetical protein, variant [Aphanomyces invadans]